MPKINESQIKQYAIDLLEAQGFKYIYGSDLDQDSDTPRQQSIKKINRITHIQQAVSCYMSRKTADCKAEASPKEYKNNTENLQEIKAYA